MSLYKKVSSREQKEDYFLCRLTALIQEEEGFKKECYLRKEKKGVFPMNLENWLSRSNRAETLQMIHYL